MPSYNCVDRHCTGPDQEQGGLIWEGEPGDRRVLRYQDLLREVSKFANVLKGLGVQKGDVVAVYMPMIPELVIALLACARIGAPHTVIFGGFSAEALAGRIQDCKAKVLLTADGGYRRGKLVPLKENADAAAAVCPTLEHVVVYRRTGTHVELVARPRPLVARAGGQRFSPTVPPSRSTASIRCTSFTPPGRRANPRASSTRRAATWSARR